MNAPKTGSWIAATVVAGLLMLVAAWFLVISPTLATAAETQEEAQGQRDQNQLTQIRVERLREQFEDMEALKTELAGLQLQIPTAADVETYKREITAAALTRGVTVISLVTGIPNPVVAAVDPAATAAEPVDPAPVTEETDGTVAPAEPAAPVDVTYGLSVTLELLGPYQNVMAFLQDLQTGTQRIYVVEQLDGTAPEPAEATNGRPAISAGDLNLVVTGSVFVLPPLAAVPDVTEEPLAPLPAPNGTNPIIPLG